MTGARRRYAGLTLLLVLGMLFVALMPSAAFAQSEADDEPVAEVDDSLDEDDQDIDDEDVDDEDVDDEDDTINFFCESDLFEHPVAASIAGQYEVEYEDVMTWFCDDELGLGQIALALHTARILENAADAAEDGDVADDPEDTAPLTAEELLAMRLEGMGWGEIWHELGYNGRPKAEDSHPGLGLGRPEGVGRPETAGRPEDAGRPDGVGRPDNTGRPDHAGRPEDAGKPEGTGRSQGASNGNHQGGRK